ncbi:MAG: type I DNA topoisomerase [Clostridia bacterium]|jgi:DNA topoisomerase-1|nr:type I DNA topoisomerase [Clostridia bacterium]MCI1999635.1 type I DNA topoisomerase [Clostridia bacterium]MCI2013986.1 type I DNA topoisomerase [Clostridia bacterium]
MAKNLVIVESPAKAKTIKRFLGNKYKIEASMGHVRDLPKSQMGVDIENDFEPKYITIRGKGELLARLRKEIKTVDKVYLATDPDREGEAISWHLVAALGLEDKDYSRITFNEITKTAVKKSLKEARDINMDLVNAQQARRVLDRVVGYSISSLLWNKVKKGLSAGRVQSVALKLICDREDEIRNFIPDEYWTIEADVECSKNEHFKAKYYGSGGKKNELKNGDEAKKIAEEIKTSVLNVDEIKRGKRMKKPLPPFTTSTLQQESSKYLNFTAQKTMMVAQQLYEGVDIKGVGTTGLVSYIRTDSVRISDEAYEDIKNHIVEKFGKEFLNSERIVYKTKSNAQDAHEAIRPAHIEMEPDAVKESLTKDQYKLYKLIWERTIACQMSPAEYETQSITLSADKHILKASGSILLFKGFLEAYNRIDDMQESVNLPVVNNGDKLKAKEVNPLQHFTQPPARYSDASLIKTLEELGVGRPSTYAPTISTIITRNYVVKEKKLFCTTELGEVVNDIMKKYFKNIVNADFTAAMEADLDSIEEGQLEWKEIIRGFYPIFKDDMENAREKLSKVEIKDEVTDVICEKCGSNMVIKYGRYGKFLACPNFPACSNAKPLYESAGVKCPLCGGEVLIKKTKKGRKYFGCENNPDKCSFVSWNKPVEQKCPKCGSYMVEKGGKNPKIVCSNPNCGYVCEKEDTKDDTKTE